MTPVEILMNEHRNVERMLDCLEAMTITFLAERRIDSTFAREAVAFLQEYADRCHHSKEEGQLFAALEAKGLCPHSGPTSAMRSEHIEGRARIQEMADAIAAGERNDDEAPTRFARAARTYLELLRKHIQKEDECLYPLASNVLDTQAMQELQKHFARFERDEMAASANAGMLKSLVRLEERFKK